MSGDYRVMVSAVFTGQHEVFRESDGAVIAIGMSESDARDFAAMKNGEVPEKYAALISACKALMEGGECNCYSHISEEEYDQGKRCEMCMGYDAIWAIEGERSQGDVAPEGSSTDEPF